MEEAGKRKEILAILDAGGNSTDTFSKLDAIDPNWRIILNGLNQEVQEQLRAKKSGPNGRRTSVQPEVPKPKIERPKEYERETKKAVLDQESGEYERVTGLVLGEAKEIGGRRIIPIKRRPCDAELDHFAENHSKSCSSRDYCLDLAEIHKWRLGFSCIECNYPDSLSAQ